MKPLIGHAHVTEYVGHALDMDRMHSSTLLSGPPGIGKTLAARNISALILCHDRRGAQACGNCTSCRAMTSGNSVRHIEIDLERDRIKNESMVDAARRLRADIESRGGNGERSVYLIRHFDRVSDQVQNALLKTIEEPPSGVYFLITCSQALSLKW
ncbi:MAG: AAA family ATPase [Planctomycetes bacterium]|nr:AAA family ATPase [Planctomycetota bacterium]